MNNKEIPQRELDLKKVDRVMTSYNMDCAAKDEPTNITKLAQIVIKAYTEGKLWKE